MPLALIFRLPVRAQSRPMRRPPFAAPPFPAPFPGMVLMLGLIAGLGGCGYTAPQVIAGGAVAGVASIAIIHRTIPDAVYSAVTGKDCSVVRLDAGKTYCRRPEPEPPAQPFCTRSLGVVDCWKYPASLPDHPRQVADGPSLNAAQEADRTRRWPPL